MIVVYNEWTQVSDVYFTTLTFRPSTHVNAVKQCIPSILILLENTNVLKNLWLDLDLFEEPNRVLAKEVKYDSVGRFKGDMFTT